MDTLESATGLVFNIQKYSISDGPGIRTTVFLKGCPLRCAWCHNPESISCEREIVVLERRCIACGECRDHCPQSDHTKTASGNTNGRPGAPGESALPPDKIPLPARLEACTLCGACIEACPTEARQMIGREMTARQILDVVLQDEVFYQESGGGVTFSGGEPLMQACFLESALAACRDRGLHTAVDTCGLVPLSHLQTVAPLTNLFLYDLKLMDPARHLHYTGASNERILENLEWLGQTQAHVWIRIPIIPGINDASADLEAIARFVSAIPSVRQVNLLPFHNTGSQKALRLGRSFELNPDPPSPEALARAVHTFQTHGLPTRIGG